MIFNCYCVTDEMTLADAPGDDPLAVWLKKRYPLWLEVAEASPDEITELLRPLDLPPLLVERCVAVGTGARVIPLPEQVFFEFPVAGLDGASYLSAIALPDLAITIRHGPIDFLDTVSRAVDEKIKLPSSNQASILGAVLFILSDQDVQTTLGKRADVNKLAADQEKDPDSVGIDDVLQLKLELRSLQAVAEEKRHCFEILSRTRSDAFDARKAGSFFQIALGNAEYLERLVDRLSDRAEDLHGHHVVWLQERTNRRLASLTVISAVFLPLTLIAGIEGMNFEHMPELKWAYGYPAMLVMMAVIAVVLPFVFWRNGWFD